jgi:hypothetical protein
MGTCWSAVIITSTHSVTVLACDRVHASARRERSRDGSEDLESCVARGYMDAGYMEAVQ